MSHSRDTVYANSEMWKYFQGVSNLDDKKEDETVKSVRDPKETSGNQNKKAQHDGKLDVRDYEIVN